MRKKRTRWLIAWLIAALAWVIEVGRLYGRMAVTWWLLTVAVAHAYLTVTIFLVDEEDGFVASLVALVVFLLNGRSLLKAYLLTPHFRPWRRLVTLYVLPVLAVPSAFVVATLWFEGDKFIEPADPLAGRKAAPLDGLPGLPVSSPLPETLLPLVRRWLSYLFLYLAGVSFLYVAVLKATPLWVWIAYVVVVFANSRYLNWKRRRDGLA